MAAPGSPEVAALLAMPRRQAERIRALMADSAETHHG
jgi:hypothetical protein